MYPFELENVIKENNYKLGGQCLFAVIDKTKNPQLVRIVFHPENNNYEMWDKYGNYYSFEALPLNNVTNQKVKKMSR